MPATTHTIHYFGHHKCGTNWMRSVLKDAAKALGLGYEVRGGRADDFEGTPGAGTVRLAVNPLAAWSPEGVDEPDRGFHLIRDPRDVLVSQYWSWKNSHENNTPEIESVRAQLTELPVPEGLAILIPHLRMLHQLRGKPIGNNPLVRVVKYEELWEGGAEAFVELFIFLGIDLPEHQTAEIVQRHSFESRTGRKPGEIDNTHHLRRGSPGGWQEAFTPQIEAEFEKVWSGEVERLGYRGP